MGPPLRPCPEDSALLDDVIGAWAAAHGVPRALVLGVTPEMTRLAWPGGTELVAVDRSQAMIGNVWPGWPVPGKGALQADWRQMPLPDRSRDIAVSDDCFAALAHEDHATVFGHVHRVLVPHGRFAFRNFVLPDRRERPAEVYDAAMAGRIGTFHAFKLRLLMAVQHSPEQGVVTGDVWASWHDDGPDPSELARATGWPPTQIATIDAYRGQATRYSFPTVDLLRAAFEGAGFVERSRTIPSYELAERCPTFVLAPGPD